MIKKNTRKVIFGKKKESNHFCLCNPGIMGFGILFSAPEGNQESVTVTINKNPESKFHWQVIWNPIYLESGIHLRACNPESKSVFYYLTWGQWRLQGRAPRGPPLAYFWTKLRPEAPRPGPPSIRVWMTPPPPRLSEGLNPPLRAIQFHVTLSIFFT